MSTLIATTRAKDLQSLGAAGQPVTESWAVLRQLLLQRLGPAHAALLAEPLTNAAQGETDWYAESEQPIRSIAALPPEQQATVRQTLARLMSDVAALAATMQATRTQGERVLGTLLDLALQVPDESYLHAAGSQPVLVAWGHAKAGAASYRVTLAGERAAPIRPMPILPPPPAPVPPVRRFGPLLSAALAGALMLLAAAFYLLGRDPLGWYVATAQSCAVDADDTALRARLDAAAGREAELRLRLAQLTTDAGGRRLLCPPVQVAAAPPPARSQDESRAQNRGGQRGKLTIILAWDDRNDLDLYVRCPDGTAISFRKRTSCGGTLDVDANENANTADVQPVENVFFAEPANGQYRVVVDPFAMRVSVETPFRVTIQQDGRPDRVVTGIAHNGARVQEVAIVTVEASP